MDKKTRIKRGETVLAMEHMARCINDEDIFWSWLSVGVADGDITEDTTLYAICRAEGHLRRW